MFTCRRRRKPAASRRAEPDHYYRFDFGKIHFIGLDSDDGEPRGQWREWQAGCALAIWPTRCAMDIAFWNHNHTRKDCLTMRTPKSNSRDARKLFCDYGGGGVDSRLADTGHAYERSYCCDSHYDCVHRPSTPRTSSTAAAGRCLTPYQKRPCGGPPGRVYAVAGFIGTPSWRPLNQIRRCISQLSVRGSS